MTTRENKLVTLARKMMLTPTQAIALPTAITVMATRLEMAEDAAIDTLMSNMAAAQYIAGLCRNAIQ